jgi:predicted alpha/beta-fold hydrolase
MAHAGELIDKWWSEDRWNYSLWQLYFKVGRHKPVPPGDPVPLKDSIMRAALAASFRVDLVEIVERNDTEYGLHVLPYGGDRREIAYQYGFTRFLHEFTYPYWKDRLHLGSYEELNADAKLINLLPQVPANAEVVIADDDPLNDPAELENVRKLKLGCKLTLLRGGGHAGYVNACWTKTKLLSIFK